MASICPAMMARCPDRSNDAKLKKGRLEGFDDRVDSLRVLSAMGTVIWLAPRLTIWYFINVAVNFLLGLAPQHAAVLTGFSEIGRQPWSETLSVDH